MRLTDQNLDEPYVIVADLNGTPLPATLIKIDNTLAQFTVDGYLDLNDTVLSCPRDEPYYATLPPMEEMRNHSERITGKIIRIEGDDKYTIRITTQASQVKSALSAGYTDIEMNEEDAYSVEAILRGSPDLDKFVRFHDCIKELSTRRLNIIINLSGVTKLPQTASAIFSDLIKYLTRIKRRIAIVNGDIIGPHFMKEQSDNDCVHHCRTSEDATKYFQRYPITILVVEDDLVTQTLIRLLLKKQKFYPIIASSGEKALEELHEQNVNLILMDFYLPGMNGIETVEQIRQIKSCSDTPIIMVTAESNRDIVKSGLELKLNGYVLKPYQPDVLARKIIAALTD